MYTKMKKIITFVLLILPVLAIGQSTTENYVKTTAYQVATQTGIVDDQQKIESITYYDGLGRPEQSVSVHAGGSKQNIVQMVHYDSLGRASKQYLPYATGTEVVNPLDFMNQGVLKDSIEFFYDTVKYEYTQNPYSETLFENSPLNRPLRQGAPGNSWKIQKDTIADHTVHYIYSTNTVSTEAAAGDDVLHFEVVFNGTDITQPSLGFEGIYAENRLSKTIVQDENFEQRLEAVGPSNSDLQEYREVKSGDHAIEEYTNKRGQVVLKRTYNEEIPHDTYYVYDDFGNLTFVLSPEASTQIISNNTLVAHSQEVLDKLGYQYIYDYRNRLVEKKIPAKGWEYIFYDVLDRPVLTQDARLRENNQYLFTKYDALNRVVYTGMYQAIVNSTRASLQATINTQNSFNEVKTAGITTIGSDQAYYSNDVFPTNNSILYTINYYDRYIDHTGITLPITVYSNLVTNDVQGLPTVSKVRVLDTNDWITTVTGYDEKARAVYGASNNTYLNTEDVSLSKLDFVGNVVEAKTIHQKTGHQVLTTTDYFRYDHQNRLVTHMQQINNEPVQLIAHNTYDELGQLETKDVGGELFESGYTDIVGVALSTEGTTIEKTNTTDAWDAGLATIGKIKNDGGVSFKMLTPGNYARVGLNDTNTTASGWDINYSFYFYNTAGGPRFAVYIWNPDTGSYGPPKYANYYNINTNEFSIERAGNMLYFMHEGVTVYTYLLDETIALIGDVGLKTPNTAISTLNLYATTIDKSLQKVDYAYNIRGWLTDINNVNANSIEPDLFNFHINYDSKEGMDATGSIQPLYNGNISQTMWRTAGSDTQVRAYGYAYDPLNRINAGFSRKGTNYNEVDTYSLFNVSYDKNGNIQALKRNGYDDQNTNSTLLIDDLSYTYIGNQLQKVDDASDVSNGFKDGAQFGNDYTYDTNGNMTSDQNKKITAISYNHLNLPTSILINDLTNGNGTITYIYDATGIKLAKVLVDNTQGITKTTSYAGGYIYETTGGAERLQLLSHPEGYAEPVIIKGVPSYQYAFNYTDHLGNVRLTYADSNRDGVIESKSEIISEKHYYPFGLKHSGYNDAVSGNVNSVANRFGYGGKELQEGLGLEMYDFGARFQDPSLGRWFVVDALAEHSNQIDKSPYAYAWNNPIYYTDPDGNCPECEAFFYKVSYGISLGQERFVSGLKNAVTKGIPSLFFSSNIANAKIAQGDFSGGLSIHSENATNMAKGTVQPIADIVVGATIVANGDTTTGVARMTEGVNNVSLAIATDGAFRAIPKMKGTTVTTSVDEAIVVNQTTVSQALEGSPMKTTQGKVSGPMVERYVERLQNGEKPPAIKVAEGNVIVDGNHRYVAGRLTGKMPDEIPGVLSSSQKSKISPIQHTVVDVVDWGGF